MKWCPNWLRHRALRLVVVAAFVLVAGWLVAARGELPSWIRNLEEGTAIEAAFFRLMSLPGGSVLFRRPPGETGPALSELIRAQPNNADLYSLRALEDEQQLDFNAAEADWKFYAEHASDKLGAQLALADFYHRRLRPLDEITVLSVVAQSPATLAESLVPEREQRSWKAFEQIFGVIQAQALPKDVSVSQYRAWIARYPSDQGLYGRFLEFLVNQKDYQGAGLLIASYRKQFPGDQVFPIKAGALVEYRQGSVEQGLAVYERSFEPLWAPELVRAYFDLLTQTDNLRRFLQRARASLESNPEDLNATARIFYYYQQQGKLDAAQEAIAEFRHRKEAAHSAWTAQELYVCARLLDQVHSYPAAARYYYALYNSKGMDDAQERAIGGLANLLLSAPETPIRFGSGELSMYQDIATMDQGPGFLNGILSLLLNSAGPASHYSEEEQRAVPYFHRSRAADLLALLDSRFPNSAQRPELHAKLLEFYAGAGESEAVIRGGREFLAAFPQAPQRIAVALRMADALARTGKTEDEFAIYDSVLRELAAQAQQVPLGSSVAGPAGETGFNLREATEPGNQAEMAAEGEEEGGEGVGPAPLPRKRRPESQAFQLGAPSTTMQIGARSPEYARVLERYLARLVEMKQVPQALAVLRREIERNPDDPGLYERLAVFLDQNKLGAEQEEVYRRAMARFPERSWYHKLARFYLRHERQAEFERLTQEVVKIFSGTDLESYFRNVVGGDSPALYLRLNQYAHRRFPHNPVFVRNLLLAYERKETRDVAAWERLLREHWFEEAGLRNKFFEYLSGTNRLEAELSTLLRNNPSAQDGKWDELVRENPAAGSFLAAGELWRSHFEDSAPVLRALAAQYPADNELGRTASSLYRSLSYFDPAKTADAVRIENNLLQASPGSTAILTRIGDIYADREMFSEAAPYWDRIPQVTPGESGGYLEAATIYWDYFDFDNALRLLEQGRKKFGNENLYSYEAGAIYENKRDYPRAVAEYVRGALAAAGDSPERRRLLDLARRPKVRDLVDAATARVAVPPNPSITAVDLRVGTFEALNRKQELTSFLDSIVSGTTSVELAEDIESLARQKSLEAVRQHALEKQAALTTDPVARLQLRYALVHLYESRKDFQAAQRNIEALYRENPKILGVVRATVDFYWRMKMQPQAIQALLQAAKDAYPDLGRQFTFEAARKATEAGQYQQARDLVAPLLNQSPYDGPYLDAMADTYAQAGDDKGLRQFYLEKIALFRSAPFSSDERKSRIATLRRGLVLALTRLKDHPGAVDQYIELVNSYPEDEGLVAEAALYALRYQREAQLVDYYSKTAVQSPRDYRWPMVLARIQTNLEDFPAAIDAYGKAIAIRPDRMDLHQARAELSERLMRFDEAVADYERVYQLAYRDPKWMEKVAAVRARQGKVDQTVAALNTALIEGRPEGAANYFEVARRLESWGMLSQAREFAEQGIHAAGAELLAATQQHAGAGLYARIMTRLRQQEKAYATLEEALQAAASSLPVLQQQIQKEGIEGITDREWRRRTRETRIQNAHSGMQAALREMGATVARYFTPEEKVAFARFAESRRAAMSMRDAEMFAIPLAETAGLADLEARWRYEWVLEPGQSRNVVLQRMRSLVDLQRRRVRFSELGTQLERLLASIDRHGRPAVLQAAEEAYRSAGDPGSELRILSAMQSDNSLGAEMQARYLELLLARQPPELVRVAALRNSLGQAAADYAVASGGLTLAHTVVAARGSGRAPVWSKAYNALVGLYFAEPTPGVNAAFLGVLGDATIGERLGKPVDRSQQLAGDTWFYYGSRYGEYQGVTKQSDPEDFLPAMLEQSPGSASGYLTVADYYAESGDTARAITDYLHTLELSPGRADVHDRLAVAYFRQGARADAVAQWKEVFAILLQQVNRVRVPESFWTDFSRAADHLRIRHLLQDLKPDVDAVLRAYLRRNGNYRSNALLRSAYVALGEPQAATSWMLDLASVAPDPTAVLADIVDVRWIPLAEREPIYQRILAARLDAVATAEGLNKGYAEQSLQSWQLRWVKHLVQTRQFSRAGEAVASLSREVRQAQAAELVPLELQIAAQTGTLDAKLEVYRTASEDAPASDVLYSAGRRLQDAGDRQSARKVLEFVFARELDEHKLVAANFLGLAEIRIAVGDVSGAVHLLRRLVLVVGAPFQNLDSAAALLEKTGRNAEAIEFLEPLVKSLPWEPAYRLRLAKARIAAGQGPDSARNALEVIASDREVPYDVRTQAAAVLAGARPKADLGSAELKLLAAAPGPVPLASANQPFFYAIRMKVAEKADAQARLTLLRSAIEDTPARDDVRIPLFQAAADRQQDEFALSVLEPLLRRGFLAGIPSRAAAEGEIGSTENPQGVTEGGEEAALAAAPLAASRAQQAEVASSLAQVMARLNRLDDALRYLRFVLKLEKSPARRAALNTRIANVRTRQQRQRLNAGRQPVLHDDLEQDRIVHPRLVDLAAPPPAKAAAKGGAIR